jgi:hypothetical protein
VITPEFTYIDARRQSSNLMSIGSARCVDLKQAYPFPEAEHELPAKDVSVGVQDLRNAVRPIPGSPASAVLLGHVRLRDIIDVCARIASAASREPDSVTVESIAQKLPSIDRRFVREDAVIIRYAPGVNRDDAETLAFPMMIFALIDVSVRVCDDANAVIPLR